MVDAASVRRFLEMSIDLLSILDLETIFLEVSQSFERTLGYSRADLIGSSLMEIVHRDDRPRIEQELAGLLAGGEAVGVVVRIRTADGDYRWVQGNARADLPAGHVYVTAADITDRKDLEEAMAAQLALEELVAAVTGELIAAADVDVPEVITQGIGRLAEVLGADRAHFMRGSREETTDLMEWLHPDSGQRHEIPEATPAVRGWWLNVMRSGRLLRLEDVEVLAEDAPDVLENLRADGVRSVLLVPLPPHRGSWGYLAMVALRGTVRFNDDATALLRVAGEAFLTALTRSDYSAALLDARRELEHRNEELERSNEELERFAHAAAHDLKAPLARVEMALAAAAIPPGDAGEQLLDVARRGAARMRQLIEDLLTYAAVGSGSGAPEEVDLDAVVAEVLADLDGTIVERGAEVVIPALPVVWGHRTQLTQLFQNLLANALKFVRSDVAPRIEVSAAEDPRGVTLRVTDNGIGIEPASRGEVFSVFTRLNGADQFPGSGIGLATCAKVVAHHEGQIHVEDGIAGGTSVVVWLPRRPRA